MPASRNGLLALVAICMAALMFGLEISSVPVILPVLEQRLGADFKDLQWIMNAYTIACTTVLMATGTLADRYGRRRVFAITLIAFGAASLLCGLAPDTATLIAARFVQGAAGGAMFICSIAILSHQFPDGKARSRAFATWGVIAGIGLGFGPVIGSALAALSGWRWVFLAHAPLALLCLALTLFGVGESSDPQARGKTLDVFGILTLTAAVFGWTYYITQGADLGYLGPAGLAIAAAASASFVAFVLIERFHAHPMFDFSVFRIRDFSGAILGCIGMNFSYWPFMIYLPLYFSAGLGFDGTATGLALLAYTLPFLVMPPVAQWLLHRYQARLVIPAGLFLIGLGFMLMKFGSESGWFDGLAVLPGALAAGIGLGLTTTPATNMTTASVPANRAGMASGIDTSARLISLAINIAVMGLLLVAGIMSSLRSALGAAFETSQLRALAEKIAGGNPAGLRLEAPQLARLDPSGDLVHAALVDGFGWVMLYGGISAWILAALSFAVFGRARLGDAGSRATSRPHADGVRAVAASAMDEAAEKPAP